MKNAQNHRKNGRKFSNSYTISVRLFSIVLQRTCVVENQGKIDFHIAFGAPLIFSEMAKKGRIKRTEEKTDNFTLHNTHKHVYYNIACHATNIKA